MNWCLVLVAGPVEAVVYVFVLPFNEKVEIYKIHVTSRWRFQHEFDELEPAKVFRRPEDEGISVDCLNSAFADDCRHSKPQPSLIRNVKTC